MYLGKYFQPYKRKKASNNIIVSDNIGNEEMKTISSNSMSKEGKEDNERKNLFK